MINENGKTGRKIGFLRSGVHPDHVLAYQKMLAKKGIGVFAVCEAVYEKKEYHDTIQVYCFEDWLRAKWGKIDISDLEQYQKKYAEYNLWEIYYTDRYMRYKYHYEDACKMMIGAFSFWEYTLRKSGADFIVSDCIIGAHNFIGMIVGQKRRVPYISIQGGRYKKYYSFFSLKEGYVDREYDAFAKKQEKLSDGEIQFVRKFIYDYINNNRHPEYIYADVNANKEWGKTIGYYLKRIKNVSYLWDRKFANKFDTKQYKGKWKTLEPAVETARRQMIKPYFEKPDNKEKYVLFPLHFQPEASTCVYARKYENQLYFIEQLSKSIPAGMVIYVKEHMVRQGHRPLSFYRRLKKYPNVKIIGPDISGSTLISHCEFVVCLTSTMGFEALMYGKPVFICGSCFFENFSGAQKIRDVFDEKEKFLTPPTQDRGLYIRQMAYYFRSLHLCTTQEQPMDDEDTQGLAKVREETVKALLNYIEQIH